MAPVESKPKIIQFIPCAPSCRQGSPGWPDRADPRSGSQESARWRCRGGHEWGDLDQWRWRRIRQHGWATSTTRRTNGDGENEDGDEKPARSSTSSDCEDSVDELDPLAGTMLAGLLASKREAKNPNLKAGTPAKKQRANDLRSVSPQRSKQKIAPKTPQSSAKKDQGKSDSVRSRSPPLSTGSGAKSRGKGKGAHIPLEAEALLKFEKFDELKIALTAVQHLIAV